MDKTESGYYRKPCQAASGSISRPAKSPAAVTVKVGDAYDEEALHRDFLTLWKTNRFDDIQMKTEPGVRGGIIVVFVVTERR